MKKVDSVKLFSCIADLVDIALEKGVDKKHVIRILEYYDLMKGGFEHLVHVCPYCQGPSDSTDDRVLCQECRQDFGHTFIDEL